LYDIGLFGSKQKDKKAKPNTIQVPPKEEENSKVEESVPVPVQPQPEVNPVLKGLDSKDFFSGMNVSKQENNPDGYNPPDLFAGMNLSMTAPSKATSQPQMMSQTASTAQAQSNSVFVKSGQMNTQNMQMNNTANQQTTQNHPNMQINTMPTQPTAGFDQDPNSMFFGMTPVDKSFDSGQSPLDTSGRNIATDFVHITKEEASQDINQTKSTDNSNL
jgi:hypothetical protein